MPSDHLIADPDAFVPPLARGSRRREAGWSPSDSARNSPRPATAISSAPTRSRRASSAPSASSRSPTARPRSAIRPEPATTGTAESSCSRADALRRASQSCAGHPGTGRRGRGGRGATATDEASFGRPRARRIRSTMPSWRRPRRARGRAGRMGWSDVGSWDALFEAGARGRRGQCPQRRCRRWIRGAQLAFRRPLVVTIGVEDLIVATGDAVLVAPRGQSQRVREAAPGGGVVDALKARGGGLPAGCRDGPQNSSRTISSAASSGVRRIVSMWMSARSGTS